MLLGKLFQSRGPALLKALLPKDLHSIFETANRTFSSLQRWQQPGGFTLIRFSKYKGTRTCKTLKVCQQNDLEDHSILTLTSNQCRSFNTSDR